MSRTKLEEIVSSTRIEAVMLALREKILSGELGPGAKITEVGMAESLGVSRTPVRLALQVLESEGLVVREPNRGFTVKHFSQQEVLAGFDVRGTLEGLACRLVAETGMRRSVEVALRACVEHGDIVCERHELDEVTVRNWTDINREFHRIIVEAAENPVLATMHEQVCHNPLVGPKSLALSASRLAQDVVIIQEGQRQHRAIWNAMRDGQSARAEHLAREHIQTAKEGTAKHFPHNSANADGSRVAFRA